eukprot:Platyproteum_vivax@DN1222_c0_g1_i1.p1
MEERVASVKEILNTEGLTGSEHFVESSTNQGGLGVQIADDLQSLNEGIQSAEGSYLGPYTIKSLTTVYRTQELLEKRKLPKLTKICFYKNSEDLSIQDILSVVPKIKSQEKKKKKKKKKKKS